MMEDQDSILESHIQKWKISGYNIVGVLNYLAEITCMELEFEDYDAAGHSFLFVVRLNGVQYGFATGRDKKMAKYKCCVKAIQSLYKKVSKDGKGSQNFRYMLRSQNLPQDLETELMSIVNESPDNCLPSKLLSSSNRSICSSIIEQKISISHNSDLPEFSKVVAILRRQQTNHISLVHEVQQVCHFDRPVCKYIEEHDGGFKCEMVWKSFDFKFAAVAKTKRDSKAMVFKLTVERLRNMYEVEVYQAKEIALTSSLSVDVPIVTAPIQEAPIVAALDAAVPIEASSIIASTVVTSIALAQTAAPPKSNFSFATSSLETLSKPTKSIAGPDFVSNMNGYNSSITMQQQPFQPVPVLSQHTSMQPMNIMQQQSTVQPLPIISDMNSINHYCQTHNLILNCNYRDSGLAGFSCEMTLGDVLVACGNGKSKKEAKAAASSQALEQISKMKPMLIEPTSKGFAVLASTARGVVTSSPSNSDLVTIPPPRIAVTSLPGPALVAPSLPRAAFVPSPRPALFATPSSRTMTAATSVFLPNGADNKVSWLNQFCQVRKFSTPKYEFSSSGPPFLCTVYLSDIKVKKQSLPLNSKKEAKEDAAKLAYEEIKNALELASKKMSRNVPESEE